jgi:Protein of unknown function (DUF3592)
LKNLNIDWRILVGALAVVAVAAGMTMRHVFRKPENPEEEERRRRFQLNQIGRIVEGHVVELVEAMASSTVDSASGVFARRKDPSANSEPNRARRLVRYSYSISGVTYETAQDVTGLEERLCLERLAAGQPASVKYDPSNPMNSILVADDWSGLN